jgi:hypothetical protein
MKRQTPSSSPRTTTPRPAQPKRVSQAAPVDASSPDARVLKAPVRRASSAAPGPEAISERAYQLFEARGGAHGHDLADWLQAEAELSAPKAARKPRRPRSEG